MADNQAQAARDETGSRIDELFLEHREALCAYCRVLLNNLADAEEIVQEAFLALARSAELDPSLNPPAYLFKTARNLCLNRRRAKARRAAAIREESRPQDGPDSVLAKRLRDIRLREAVLALPPRQREVVVLSCFAGLKFTEIAAVTGVTAGTVAGQKARAVRKLKQVLARDFEEWMRDVD